MYRRVLLLFAVNAIANSQIIFDQWYVKANNELIKDVKASVPGGIYSDLMDNKIIEDIFTPFYDILYKWIPREQWTYYSTFTVKEELLRQKYVEIVFEGLDTFAKISINDQVIGESQNMFVRYVFDIKKVLKIGVNTIEVIFDSPVEVATDLAINSDYVIPPECPNPQYNGECHVNQIRKMQASFSWDWGPAFPSVGIWRNVSIRGYDVSVLEYVTTEVVNADEDNWRLQITIYYSQMFNNTEGSTYISLEVQERTIKVVVSDPPKKNDYGEIVSSINLTIPKADVKLWWPNGYGDQKLYSLTTTFKTDTKESQITRKIGFRTIELVQEKLGGGLSFYFKINGEPIFMKGANEIPLHILPEKVQNKNIRKLLRTVKDANMNMLRVWGGGIYESDYFYETTDEMGILIWQDFMFACALYPTTDNFLRNVREEIRHNVKRLYGHPSIALWAGNNENEAALAGNWYGSNDNKTLYVKDYITLYINTVKEEFNRLTNSQGLFLSSSPSNGAESTGEGYVAQNPGNPLFGDVHFYNYILNPLDVSTYPVPRFASEFGYQSFPSVDSMLTITNASDLHPDSDFMQHIQHHPGGNLEIKLLIDYNLQLPNETNENYYRAFIYYNQIMQALSTKVETEYYRSLQSSLNSAGQGKTMGALYWQLNDVWLAPTWSGIDYLGKWKMLMYYAVEFFAPVIVTGSISPSRDLNVYAVSDLLTLIPNVSFVMEVYRWNSTTLEPANIKLETFDLDPTASKLIVNIPVDDYLAETKSCGDYAVARYNCFIHIVLQKSGVNISPDNFVFPAKLKDTELPVPNLKIAYIKTIGEKTFEIEVATDAVSLFVWLETGSISGRFSENGFIQITKTKIIYFHSDDHIAKDELQKKLTITNLRDKIYL